MQLSQEEFRCSARNALRISFIIHLSSREKQILTSTQWHGSDHSGHPELEPLVLELVSTPARGNENSWEAVESRTARQSETDEEAGRVLQG